jgi:hypothetical protein
MTHNSSTGWPSFLSNFPWYEGEDKFPLPAYSEFMPSPKIGLSPLGDVDRFTLKDEDPFGWYITELDEELELKPGLDHVARQIMHNIVKLGKGETEYHISGHNSENLVDNPYWPDELKQNAGKLNHERYLILLPLALSKTQDDKGRVRWTFFGGSEQGPEKAFWKSFYSAPDVEIATDESLAIISGILNKAYGLNLTDSKSIYTKGFRILLTDENTTHPSWTNQFRINEKDDFSNIKYLLTFKPFKLLPPQVKQLYLEGKLNLLPFPGSLVFWGMPTYKKLQKELPQAFQIPMLKIVARHSGHGGIRVPQSGWLHEPHPDVKLTDFHQHLVNNSYHRTHRWQRVHKHEDELLQKPRVDKLIKILFSTELESMGLYDKPLARNCVIWDKHFNLLLNGPIADRHAIVKAEAHMAQGGLFGYRFLFPPMQAGQHNIFWHRPIIAFQNQNGETEIISHALNGYITGYQSDNNDISEPVELWPRIQNRDIYIKALHGFDPKHDHFAHQAAFNIINLFDHWEMTGKKPISRELAFHLIKNNKHTSVEHWLEELPGRAFDKKTADYLVSEIEKILEPKDYVPSNPNPLTYELTRKREFEEAWWNDIHFMAHGKFVNKDNADCVQDEATLNLVPHRHRDLEHLGDYLISRHRNAIAKAGMEGKAYCGELPFEWRTDFVFDAFGGWRLNQEGHTYERNILVVIPGKNRNEAVVMGDHYDTAYMEDVYDKDSGGSGARLSASGADDNYSATSTLLQAAPIFLQLAKEGKLERDIWLLHLTGEEFPSDCLGARNFCKHLVEKTLRLRLDKNNAIDLSKTKVVAAYIMDMIGHNKDTDRDIFQISPGKSKDAFLIAMQAHIANMQWNKLAHNWNHEQDRLHLKKGERINDLKSIPVIAKHAILSGEVRTQFNPHSSIYNTDGQIFSDIGAPVVLFMENYDLHRTGYHDQHDTMENIDLDYGAALAAICIESAAKVATLKFK